MAERADVSDAIRTVEGLRKQLDAAIVAFVVTAFAHGWAADEVVDDLERWGCGLEPKDGTAADVRH